MILQLAAAAAPFHGQRLALPEVKVQLVHAMTTSLSIYLLPPEFYAAPELVTCDRDATPSPLGKRPPRRWRPPPSY